VFELVFSFLVSMDIHEDYVLMYPVFAPDETCQCRNDMIVARSRIIVEVDERFTTCVGNLIFELFHNHRSEGIAAGLATELSVVKSSAFPARVSKGMECLPIRAL
jgi:hypothetical protein